MRFLSQALTLHLRRHHTSPSYPHYKTQAVQKRYKREGDTKKEGLVTLRFHILLLPEVQSSLCDLRPTVLLHVFAVPGIDPLHISAHHPVEIAGDPVRQHRKLPTPARQDILPADA